MQFNPCRPRALLSAIATVTLSLSSTTFGDYLTYSTFQSTSTGTGMQLSSVNPSFIGMNNQGIAAMNGDHYVNSVNQGTTGFLWNGSNITVVNGGIIALSRDSNTFVGSVVSNSSRFASTWDANGTLTQLPGNLGTDSSGHSSTTGQGASANGTFIVGSSTTYNAFGNETGSGALKWTNGVVSVLSTPAGNGSVAYVVNNSGIAVGTEYKYSYGGYNGNFPVRWDSSGNMIEMGFFNPQPVTTAVSTTITGINASGYAIGLTTKTSATDFRAVAWDPSGQLIELQNLGTGSIGILTPKVSGINDSGTIIGYIPKFVSGVFQGVHPMKWNTTGAGTELPNAGIGAAIAINAAGIIGGDAFTGATIWRPDGTYIDLNMLTDPAAGIMLGGVKSITDSGLALVSASASRMVLVDLKTLSYSKWSNSSGGTWTTTSNWESNSLPGATANVVFDQMSTYTVTPGAAVSTGDIKMENGKLTLDVSSQPIQAANTLTMFNGQLTIPGTLKAGTAGAGELGVSGKIYLRTTIASSQTPLSEPILKVNSLNLGGDTTRFVWKGGTLDLNGGSTDTGLVVPYGGTIAGNGTINGNLSGGGAFSPGHSAGELDVNGNLTLSGLSQTLIELGGTVPASQYDVLHATGSATISSGAQLSPTFINGYVPVEGDGFAILTASSLSGIFTGRPDNTTFFIGTQLMRINYDYTPGNSSVTLLVVPEPTSFGLIGLSMLTLLRRGNQRRHT